jgi:hypothetical protein
VSQETHVQQAFQATAALFRALGVSQKTASTWLGLRGHTSFSFWKTGTKEFESRYAEALYKLIVETVNAHWPKRFEEQEFAMKKLIGMMSAWRNACVTWQKDIYDTTQQLRHTIARLEQYGDTSQLSYLQEHRRIVCEIAQLTESLQHVLEFQDAWACQGRNMEAVLEEKERRHLAAQAAQPPPKPKSLRRSGQGNRLRRGASHV